MLPPRILSYSRSLLTRTHQVVSRKRYLASLAEEVRSDNTFHIPVVQFRKFREAKSEGEKKNTANEIVSAFKEVGFVYLSDHGISDSVVRTVFQESKNFFDLPLEVKAGLAWDDPRSNRGYVQQGRERVTQSSDPDEILRLRAQAPDVKETMEIGRDWDSPWENKWPQQSLLPQFQPTMLNFFRACHNLHVSVMSSVALGLGLPQEFFAKMIDEQYHNLRLLHYPPVPDVGPQASQSRAGAHSDYGSLTFVFQDNVGGLEVQNPHTGHYHPATPIPGTVVVNVGDLLARWSNDVLRSTLHRVVTTAGKGQGGMKPSRQSIAFFCNPNGRARIEALPTCVASGSAPKYQPVETEQYIVQRLTDTYS